MKVRRYGYIIISALLLIILSSCSFILLDGQSFITPSWAQGTWVGTSAYGGKLTITANSIYGSVAGIRINTNDMLSRSDSYISDSFNGYRDGYRYYELTIQDSLYSSIEITIEERYGHSIRVTLDDGLYRHYETYSRYY